MANVLVVGGAGYIGSHMADLLVRRGHQVVVFDNLSAGYRDAVLDATLVVGDLADTGALNRCFEEHHFDAVMHFASLIQVGESMRDPGRYYHNIVGNSLNLLDVMREHDVNRMIFSSSAAVFGDPRYTPIDDDHPKNPINPYGCAKWMVEQVLQDYGRAYDLRSVSLRYFNAAGADPEGRLGERHNPETHLIPLVLQVAAGERDAIAVYGDDYDTPDGTCIRDYIHVVDLCEAHLLALDALLQDDESAVYNLGNGQGYSVKQVIKTAEKVTQKEIPVKMCERRLGDAPSLVADARRAEKVLGWQPAFSALETIIQHAWRWQCQQVSID